MRAANSRLSTTYSFCYDPDRCISDALHYLNRPDIKVTASYKDIASRWQPEYDDCIRSIVEEFGCFWTAHDGKVFDEVRVRYKASFPGSDGPRISFIRERASQMNGVMSLWRRSFTKFVNSKYVYKLCGHEELVFEAHPTQVRDQGIPPKYCRRCFYLHKELRGVWDEQIINMLRATIDGQRGLQSCKICGVEFVFLQEESTFQPIFTYINCIVPVCRSCYTQAVNGSDEGSKEEHLAKLNQLYLHSGEVPPHNPEQLVLFMRDEMQLLKFLTLLSGMPGSDVYVQHCGSYLQALKDSGILPDGARRLIMGTLVEAEDGHICLSIPERDIDNWLYTANIAHRREPYYPNCGWRADWEVMGCEHRIFIEYFGLVGKEEYDHRARSKLELAREHGIELIAIEPRMDWRSLLRDRFAV